MGEAIDHAPSTEKLLNWNFQNGRTGASANHGEDAPPPYVFPYVLSFIVIGIYWSNHHHLMQAADHVNGRVLWSNLSLLFWLSLQPFAIRWLDESGFAAGPTAAWGMVLAMASLSWIATVRSLIVIEPEDSPLRDALSKDRKAWISLAGYGISMSLAFVEPWLAMIGYAASSGGWLIPDRRIERAISDR